MKLAAVLALVFLAGCASMPAGLEFVTWTHSADTALSTYARTQLDLVEVGPLHQGQDVAVVVAFDMAILWALHRAHKRWPGWPGWPVVWWVSGSVKGLVTLFNLGKILEAGE